MHDRGYMMHRPRKITAAKRQFMAGNAIIAQASASCGAPWQQKVNQERKAAV